MKHLLKDLRLLKHATDSMPTLDMMIDRLAGASQHGHSDRDFTVIYQQMRRVGI